MQALRRSMFWLVIVIAVLVVILSWLPQMLTMNPDTSYGDEGVIAQAARRVVLGELPYRDYFSAIPPAAAYWYGGALALFGDTFLGLRIGVLLTACMILVCSCSVLYRLGCRNASTYLVVVSFLAFFGGPYWFVASHHWLSLAWLLVSLILLIPGEGESSPAVYRFQLFASGSAATIAAFSLQNKGGAWIFAVMIGLLLIGGKERRRNMLWFLGGVIVTGFSVLTILAALVGMKPLFLQSVWWPLTRYHQTEGHQEISIFSDLLKNWTNVVTPMPSPGAGYPDWIRYLTWNTGYLGRVIVHVLPFSGAAALVYLWRSRLMRRDRAVLLTVFFAAMYLSMLYRIHETTLVFSALAAVIPISVVLGENNTFNGVIGRLLTSGWIALFSAIALGFVCIEFLPGIATATTAAGTVKTRYAYEAQELSGVQRYLDQHRNPNDMIFCYSYVPMYYFLLQVRNPIPYDILIYPMNTQEQLDETQAILDHKRCRWIIWNRTSLWGNSFGQYIDSHYTQRAAFPGVAILERNVEANENAK